MIQCTGDEKSRVITAEQNRFTFTAENGYPEAVRETLASFVRDFDCQPEALVLSDSFEFSAMPESVVEQFVSLTPIDGDNGHITCGDSVLTYDSELYDMELGSEDFRRNNGTTETLYWVRLSVKKPEDKMTLKFTFK